MSSESAIDRVAEPPDVWWSYDCSVGCDTVLDIRAPYLVTPRTVTCPLCGQVMSHRASWDATHAGYGSLADQDQDGRRYREIASRKLDMLRRALREVRDVVEKAADAFVEFEVNGEHKETKPLRWTKNEDSDYIVIDENDECFQKEHDPDPRDGMALRLEATARDMRKAIDEDRNSGPAREQR